MRAVVPGCSRTFRDEDAVSRLTLAYHSPLFSAGSGACVGFGVGLARACPTLSGSASILVSAFSCQSMR